MFHVFTLGLHTDTDIWNREVFPSPPSLMTSHLGIWHSGKCPRDLEKFRTLGPPPHRCDLFDMFHVFPPGLHSTQNSKFLHTTPPWWIRENGPLSPGGEIKFCEHPSLPPPPDGTWRKLPSIFFLLARKNNEGMSKIWRNMWIIKREYVKNMKE